MIDETLFEAEEKMDKAVSVAKDDFAAIRTGRAHPGMFAQDRRRLLRHADAAEPARVGFTVAEPRMIVITPYDKGSLRAIEKAIRDSDLGVNPTNDGNIIRVSFPQLTEERRRDYVKVARSEGRGRAGSRSATSAGTPRTRSTSSARTARPARTTSTARRRNSTTSRTATWRRSTRCCGTRKSNFSRSDVNPEHVPSSVIA